MKFFKIFFFFAIPALLMAIGCSEEPTAPAKAQLEKKYEGVIVAVGDSLTEGLGVQEELAYPAVLEERLGEQGYRYQVVNAGISGETSSGTLSRINWVLTLKPDIVILVIGANDGFRGIDPELIKSNIRTILKSLNEKNVTVVLGGMQMVQNLGQDYTSAFAEIYPEVARSEDVIFIPFFLAGVAASRDLNQADGIHPTAEGYQVIVDNIAPHVIEAIKIHSRKENNHEKLF
ncbi:Arylesterase precursor (EC [Olavius sp. associated proteobacterium Delta 1]|nr:Arylesterase precursor (EC [Olavius sp. associated proteobacterium Delta 1]